MNGTGPGGRIVRADVRGASAGVPASPAPSGTTDVELTTTQRLIAQRMSESRAQIPDFTLEAEIDMEAAAELREELRALGREPLPSFNDLVVKAVALALRRHPAVNSSWAGDRIRRNDRVNVGVAVATDDALYVPTIFDADRLSIFEIAELARGLIEKIGQRTVTMEELQGGTFTVSNLGMFGIRRFNAVINPPQAAILAVGEVARRAGRRPGRHDRGQERDGRRPLVRPPRRLRSGGGPIPANLQDACSSGRSRSLPHDGGNCGDRVSGRDPRRAGRGARPRRERDLLRRGRRRRGRRLRRDTRAVREVRGEPRVRHADLGARDDGRRVRRGRHRGSARCSRSCSGTSSRSPWTA